MISAELTITVTESEPGVLQVKCVPSGPLDDGNPTDSESCMLAHLVAACSDMIDTTIKQVNKELQ